MRISKQIALALKYANRLKGEAKLKQLENWKEMKAKHAMRSRLG
jgi:hypothetical protein